MSDPAKCHCGSDYDPETGVCNRTGILANHCDAASVADEPFIGEQPR
jgi:hypothetical protein